MMVKYMQLFQGQELSFFVCLFVFLQARTLSLCAHLFLESELIHILLYLILYVSQLNKRVPIYSTSSLRLFTVHSPCL